MIMMCNEEELSGGNDVDVEITIKFKLLFCRVRC